MAKETQESAAAAAEGQSLLTLTEVAKRTGISMPTLQKYKKRFGDRIPSEGKGRTQRYPESSLLIFGQLRDENMSKRGRPRKQAAAAAPAAAEASARNGKAAKAAKASKGTGATGKRRGRPAKAKPEAATAAQNGSGMLTLTQVAKKTNISYPTLLRYVKNNLDQLPHVGKGRGRRFDPAAVEVFAKLRAESRRGPASGAKRGAKAAAVAAVAGARRRPGRPPGRAAKVAAVKAIANVGDSKLAAVVAKLEQRLAKLEAQMKKPLRVTINR